MKKITFPSFSFREVLGLSFKILFHKNKENKRMLSKKMAFSLTSLITILALAFVVTPAMAGEFDVSIDMMNDVSAADGLQLVHPGDDENIKVTVKFAKAVVLPAANVFVTTSDKMDKLVSIPAATVAPATADKKIVLTIPVKAASAKVNIRIAKGIASADPIDADTSKALDVTVGLVSDDQMAGPTVYSIRRADNPLLPVTAATVQVIVTLSEMPKEFKKGNLSITDNATIADPVALDPIPAGDDTSLGQLIQEREASKPPPIRGLYDPTGADAPEDDPDTPINENKGIHYAINMGGSDLMPTYEDPGAADPTTSKRFTLPVDSAPDPLVAPIVEPPKTLAAASTTTPQLPIGTDRTIAPTMPKAADFATGEAFTNALAFYNALKTVNDAYKAELKRHNAYKAAVKAEMDKDEMARDEYFRETLGVVVPRATGRDDMLHPYVVTITPKYPAGKANIVLKVGAWEDTNSPISGKYTPPLTDDERKEGIDMLTIKVGKETLTALSSGTRLDLPHGEGAKIPANGFYLLTKNKDGSGINYSHEKDAENLAHKQTPAQLLFNVRAAGIANLESFFLSGGTIDLVAYDGTAATAAYISEVMWGSDASQDPSSNSQWIEIMNATASAIDVGEKKWALWFYQAHETPPTTYPDSGVLIDRIGTERSDTGVFWSVVSTAGQSGRTNIDPGGADVVAIAPTRALVSMIRATDASNAPLDGTLPTSWAATATGTSANFKLGIEGTRWATPGAADIARPTEPAPPPPPEPTVPAAAASDIMITEIMVDAGNGRLPQWIELTHVGTGEVSLDGWEMVIDNAIDTDVIGGGNAITISLSGAELDVSAHTGSTGKGQSILVVAWASARHSPNIRAERVINIATQLSQTRQYQLLSYKGFRITLVPPQTGAIAAFGDVAGNLDEEWEIPMAEGSTRSSMIRRQTDTKPNNATHIASKNFTGTDANGWILASETGLTTGQVSYYGSDEDNGTPGQDAGGPLPVELSHFRPARDKQTGAVVITWATESELNNAGFFIKRSNQRDGQFQVINATMIAGAGTTSEKQFYTYTDTTAQPNVVYYYQIEDVSLDGNRQTLTRGIRLKGHVGAAGKATVIWGELKTSHE